MTTDLQSELAEVLALLEKATPGEWFTGHLCRDDHACNCPFIFSEGQIGMGAIATVGTTDEDVGSEAEAKANQAVIVAAVNFLRKHGAALSHGGGGEAVATYGVIDPDYARVFTIARCLAWAEGYMLAMHGSFTRDLDLIAVPWADHACEPEHLMRRIEDAAGLRCITEDPGGKPHGRLVWTLKFKTFGDPRFVDLGIIQPRRLSTAGQGWQPIESAPKDVRVIVWNPVTGQYISQQRDDGEWPMHGWGDMRGVWYPRPTLWQPLPPTPEQQKEGR